MLVSGVASMMVTSPPETGQMHSFFKRLSNPSYKPAAPGLPWANYPPSAANRRCFFGLPLEPALWSAGFCSASGHKSSAMGVTGTSCDREVRFE